MLERTYFAHRSPQALNVCPMDHRPAAGGRERRQVLVRQQPARSRRWSFSLIAVTRQISFPPIPVRARPATVFGRRCRDMRPPIRHSRPARLRVRSAPRLVANHLSTSLHATAPTRTCGRHPRYARDARGRHRTDPHGDAQRAIHGRPAVPSRDDLMRRRAVALNARSALPLTPDRSGH